MIPLRISLLAAFVPLAALAGCLGGDAPAPQPTLDGEPAAILVSAYDDAHGFTWVGVEGLFKGQVNPNITLASGEPLRLVIRHGDGPADQGPHNVHIMDGQTMYADTLDIAKPGDEQVVQWMPTADGVYTYACKYHGFSQAGFILVGNASLPPVTAPETPIVPPPPPEPVALAFVSHLDLTQADPLALPNLPYEWVAEGGDYAGQSNPAIEAVAGTPFVITFRHGDDPGDIDAHHFLIMLDGNTVADGGMVPAGGEAVLEWTPAVAGAYTYLCDHHPSMTGTISIGMQVVTLESQYDASAGFQWKGVEGTGGGAVNPALSGGINGTLRIVYRHGSGLGDDQMHNLRLKDANGDVLVEGADIMAAGDEANIEWTFAAPGTYAYECKYHGAGQGGSISVQ